jgi:cysteine-rich repeat protein
VETTDGAGGSLPSALGAGAATSQTEVASTGDGTANAQDVGVTADAGADAEVSVATEETASDDGGAAGAAGAPASVYCGDGVRGTDEECDDGSAVAGDACSNDCRVTDFLVDATPASDALPRAAGRALGAGRHPVASGSSGFAVAFMELDDAAPGIRVALFDRMGASIGDPVEMATASRTLLFSDPVLAALPDGRYAVAWTDSVGDGDALGVALRSVDSAGGASNLQFANASSEFSQRDPDVVWTGSELVVAWVDDANVSTAPDVVYRRFSSSLEPQSDTDEVLAATGAHETGVALAPFGTAWAAAWRSAADGSERVAVASGSLAWSVEALAAGPSDDKPALAALDGQRLLVIFTEGTDPLATGAYATPRLRGAVLDAAALGDTASFAISPLIVPYDSDATIGQSHPNLVVHGDRAFIAWRSAAVTGSASAEELWLKEVRWSVSGDVVNLELGAPEVRLARAAEHTAGDQTRPALAVRPSTFEPALFGAWNDYGLSFGALEHAPDVVAELIPLPALRLPSVDGGLE